MDSRLNARLIPALALVLLTAAALAACGNKTPESEEAKKIGNIPKQTIDNSKAKIDAAVAAGAQRTRDADEKQDKP